MLRYFVALRLSDFLTLIPKLVGSRIILQPTLSLLGYCPTFVADLRYAAIPTIVISAHTAKSASLISLCHLGLLRDGSTGVCLLPALIAGSSCA
jgi:hypothetical protein